MEYVVKMRVDVELSIPVEAETIEEAKELAKSKFQKHTHRMENDLILPHYIKKDVTAIFDNNFNFICK